MYKLENEVQWTSALKNAFKHNITRASLIYGNNQEINENNNLSSLTLDEQRYISNLGFIGTATARKLDVNLVDPNGTLNLEDEEFTLKIGADSNSKNILDVGTIETRTLNGITCTYNSTTQEITFDGTCTTDNTQFKFKNTSIPVIKNKTKAIVYYVSGSVTGFAKLRFFDSNYQSQINFSFDDIATQEVVSVIANANFTAVNNSIRFNAGTVCNNLKIKVMLTNDATENIEYDNYYPSTVYINYGNFIVDKQPEVDATSGKISITAYDYMIKFNKPFVDRMTYPCTLLQLLQDICSQAGVVLGTTDFPNKTFSVTDNQFEGATLREVLQNIAKCAFSWARIGQDNKLYLDFNLTADATETITIDEYKTNSFKKANEYYGPVNQVTYADSNIEGQEARVKDQASIDQNGLKELVIYDNLFAYTPEKRETLIQAGARLLGLTYMPVTQLELVGLAYLDCNDVINVGTLDNQTYTTRVFNHKIKYTGVLTDSVVTDGTSGNEEKYKNTAANIFQNQQTRIIVDKANKRVNALVQEVGEYDTKIRQLEIDIDGIETEVSNAYDLTRTAEGTRQVTLEECLKGYVLEMHIIGNNYVVPDLYPADDLYPSDNLYPYGSSDIVINNIIVTDSNGNATTYNLGITGILRANNEVYDEYVFKDNYAKVIRRVNTDGTTKAVEEVENIGEYTIYVEEGNNTVRLKENAADFSVKYIQKNSYTDQFVATVELGTKIIQNEESVKVAWNQISEAIQMMGIGGRASLAIVDANGKILSSFDETGQHFYNSSQQVFGDMGVKTVSEYDEYGQEQTYNYIAFSVPADYNSYIHDGMAWGVETPDKKFWPIMFVKNFYVAPQQSGAFGGQIRLNNCDFVLGATSGIVSNAVRLTAEPTGEMVFNSEANYNIQNLLTLYPEGHYEETYGGLKILNKIKFYKNAADSETFYLGNQSNYVYFTSDGTLSTSGNAVIGGTAYFGFNTNTGFTSYGDSSVQGNIYANNISSDKRYKTDIKDCEVSALDKILKIEHKQFTKTTDNQHYDIGYIAQDIEKVDKNFVLIDEKSEDKKYYINELPIIATLTKAMQEQQEQINELKNEISKLKGEKNG